MQIYLDSYATSPTRAHDTDAGLDLYSPITRVLRPGETALIDLGVHIALPAHSVGMVKARSSLFKRGILTDGTIDEGYTGPVCVMLYNASGALYTVQKGDRIAQLVILPILRPELEVQTAPLAETERGSGGFGSTGK